LLRCGQPNTFSACVCTRFVEAGDPEAIDVYRCEEGAQRALEDCLRDEPQGRDVRYVEEITLEVAPSAN
jgi:hypothetical protein